MYKTSGVQHHTMLFTIDVRVNIYFYKKECKEKLNCFFKHINQISRKYLTDVQLESQTKTNKRIYIKINIFDYFMKKLLR